MRRNLAASDLRYRLSSLAIWSSVAVILYSVILGSCPKWFDWAFLGIIFSKYMNRGYARSFEISLSTAQISLFIVPATLSVYAAGGEFIPYVATAELFCSALLAAARYLDKERYPKPVLNDKFRFKLWVALLIAIAVGWNLGFDMNSFMYILFFSAPFAASLVVVELSVNRLLKWQLYAILAIYTALILYYSFFFWSGYGRLVIAAFVMMPILLINQHRDIGLRVWHLGIILPISLLGAFILRFQDGDFERLGEDSWSSHLTLTVEMAQSLATRRPAGLAAYLDQYLLLFFQWVPRDAWPSKPTGVGLAFVDEWMGRAGFSDGHSIALGFIGESLWYFGYWFPIGVVILFISIIFIRHISFQLGYRLYSSQAITDAFLPSLLWGGMATYGSRIWFCLIPALLTIYVLRPRAAKYRHAWHA